ncbi:reverse transcriptase, partial [Phytophthora megakarya]
MYDGRIEQLRILSDRERKTSEAEKLRQLFAGSTTESEDTLSAKTKKERFEEQSWDSLKSSPYYEILREQRDVLLDEIPVELPQDNGIQHVIDLVAGMKYCAIDEIFESRRKAGQVRESKSLHSAPTFCVKKPQGGWRIVHAYNKLNDATIPVQTPIPRKDVIIDSMSKSTIHSAYDLRDGFYQILIRESDILLTALSTPNGMLWEWLVMPQGLKNVPATFNRCVTHLLRSVGDFADLGLCDASDFAIGCALMQPDHEGRDRVVYYQSRQLKQADRNYPVHDKELFAMKYALAKFRVLNVVADALSRRPDYAVKTADINQIYVARRYTLSSSLLDEVKAADDADADAKQLIEFLLAPSDKACRKLAPRLRASAHRYRVYDGLLLYSAVDDNAEHIVVPNDPDLRSRIMYEYHDTARLFVEMVFKHHGMSTDIVSDRDPRFTAHFWQEVFTLLGTRFSMLTADHPQTDGQTEHVNRVLVGLLKSYTQSFHNWSDYMPMAEFAINNAVHASTGHTPFFVNAMRHPRLPSTLGAVVASSLSGGSTVASEQPQKTAETDISAATTRARARARTRQGDVSVPGTDTVKLLRPRTTCLCGAQTPRGLTHRPGLFTALAGPVANTHEVSVPGADTQKSHAQSGTDATTNGESVQTTDADKTNEPDPGFSSQAMDFVQERQAVVRFVQDAIAASADRQKLNADNVGRGNTTEFKIGPLVLLATQNLPTHAVSGFGASKLAPRFIGPFMVTKRHGNAYRLELPSDMRLHPTFY